MPPSSATLGDRLATLQASAGLKSQAVVTAAFCDDFNTFDTARWNKYTTPGYWGFYNTSGTYDAANTTVENGHLVLKLNYVGGNVASTTAPAVYKSAVVQSLDRMGYGTYETWVRAANTSNVPATNGSKVDGTFSLFNNYMEYDYTDAYTKPDTLIESKYGYGTANDLIFTTYKTNKPETTTQVTTPQNLSQGFHLQRMEWSPTALKFYVDGALVYSVTDPNVIPSEAANVFFNIWPVNKADWSMPGSQTTRYTMVDKFCFTPQTPAPPPPPAQVTNIDSSSPAAQQLLGIIQQSPYRPAGVAFNSSSFTVVQLPDETYHVALLETKVTTLAYRYFLNTIAIRDGKIGTWYRMAVNKTTDRIALSNLITGGNASVTGYSGLTDAQKAEALKPALYEPIQRLSQTFRLPVGQASAGTGSSLYLSAQANEPCTSELSEYKRRWDDSIVSQTFLPTSWLGSSSQFLGDFASDLQLITVGDSFKSRAVLFLSTAITIEGLRGSYASVAAYQAAQTCLAATGFTSSQPVIALLSPLIPSTNPLPGIGSNTLVLVKSVPDGINLYSGNTDTQDVKDILKAAIPNAEVAYEVLSGNTILFNSSSVSEADLTIKTTVANRSILP